MKRYIAVVFSLLFLVVPVFSASSAEGQALQLRSVKADFIQEKHLKILAKPLISTGTFAFQAPQSLRWEYRTPVASILLMDNGKVRKYVQRDGRFVEDRGMGLDSMQVVLAQISSWLDGRFEDNDMFAVTFPDERTVLLTPRNKGLAGMINRIELRLAEQKGLLDAVTIYEGPDSFTRMTFQHRVLNEQLPDSLFSTR